jgi:hypothetical protein
MHLRFLLIDTNSCDNLLAKTNTKSMDQKIEKTSLLGTLKLPSRKIPEGSVIKEVPNNVSSKKLVPATPKSKPNFNAIYVLLHTKFPEIINFDKPVLLAVGIRKEMSKASNISGVILKKWIAYYCRKSNYYSMHKQGATRFNLDGSEAGIVTQKHQEEIDGKVHKIKVCKISSEVKDIASDMVDTSTTMSQ